MSEIAIASTREVIYEPSLQKSGKIKVTLKVSQGFGVWNLDVKYFGVSPKVGTREVQVQDGDCIFGIKKNEWVIYENN